MTPPIHFTASRDYGHGDWNTIGMATDQGGAMELLIEAFRDDDMDADLSTVIVTRFSDTGYRDMTEDVLRAIGTLLDQTHTADTYPAPFLAWAHPDIQAQTATAAEAAWLDEDRIEQAIGEAA